MRRAKARCALPSAIVDCSCGRREPSAYRHWSLLKLLAAAEHVIEEKDTEEDLRLLFAPGSSLGGARPKASVIEKDGHLAIAKFPRKDDEINTVVWEAVALTLAKKAGITVPATRVATVAKKPVLLLRRFDRNGKRRIPFLSAMSMLGSKDNDTRSYLEIVDALRQHRSRTESRYGSALAADGVQYSDLQH
jgi:serine/threonine-protein kinase HipA